VLVRFTVHSNPGAVRMGPCRVRALVPNDSVAHRSACHNYKGSITKQRINLLPLFAPVMMIIRQLRRSQISLCGSHQSGAGVCFMLVRYSSWGHTTLRHCLDPDVHSATRSHFLCESHTARNRETTCWCKPGFHNASAWFSGLVRCGTPGRRAAASVTSRSPSP
jgi:hypothetical protein